MVRTSIIAVCVVLLSVSSVGAQTGEKYVEVTGLATYTVPAEILRLTMTVVAQAETAEKAYERAIRRSEDLVSTFRQFGFGPDDYLTRYVVERRPLPREKNKLTFLAAVGLSLMVDDFSAGTRMLDVATQFGVRDLVAYFDVTDRRAAYERALRRALVDAQVKAEALAGEMGVKIGSMIQFAEMSEPPRDYIYPHPLIPPAYEEIEEGQTPPAGKGSVRMAPQPYEVDAQVRVAFAIIE